MINLHIDDDMNKIRFFFSLLTILPSRTNRIAVLFFSCVLSLSLLPYVCVYIVSAKVEQENE